MSTTSDTTNERTTSAQPSFPLAYLELPALKLSHLHTQENPS
ncbi:hypothetical protein [Ornithinimicrobium cryptoxanthini]|nr:hypothetical protein [Ornithinimicrobium cryptoxanthini]